MQADIGQIGRAGIGDAGKEKGRVGNDGTQAEHAEGRMNTEAAGNAKGRGQGLPFAMNEGRAQDERKVGPRQHGKEQGGDKEEKKHAQHDTFVHHRRASPVSSGCTGQVLSEGDA